MPNQSPYSTIFFDWDGTLSTSRFWGHWQDGEQLSVYNRIQKDFFINQTSFVRRWMRGCETAEGCSELVASALGIDNEVIYANLRLSCESMEFVSSDIPAALRRLRRKGLRLAIATDNMDTFKRWTVPAMGLDSLFDDVLDSWSLQALKRDVSPIGDSPFFSAYLTKHGIGTGECLLIDDRSMKELARFGIDSVQVSKDLSLPAILESLTAP